MTLQPGPTRDSQAPRANQAGEPGAAPHTAGAPQGGTQAPEVPLRHTQAGSSPCSPLTGPCTLTYGKPCS